MSIQELCTASNGAHRIEILTASGISHTNALQTLTATDCTQLHSSFSRKTVPPSSHSSPFDCLQKETDGTAVTAIRRNMNKLESRAIFEAN